MRLILTLFILIPQIVSAQVLVSDQPLEDGESFSLVNDAPTDLWYDSSDDPLISRSVAFLAGDIEKVTGQKPEVLTDNEPVDDRLVIIGTIGQSQYVDILIEENKLDVEPILGDWERFIIETIKDPFPGVSEALVIVGSDRRGTAYGVFTIAEKIGVSPWYWWADVPIKKSDELYLKKDRFVSKAPSVKYRGIFLNDEAPALRGWAEEKFGGFNHEFYEKVFELLLRNKANYLWPAMWRPSAFADDDPENPRLADEYGIVISTTHHEPMMRAHDEWDRYGEGAWNYQTNKENLQEFWRGGIERMGDYESVVTVGMRGDGDEAMSEETAVGMMKNIISDQREIIEEVTGEPAEETPQVWAIYKEVQDYYDKGMRVEDDILVLFCDDNWGNIRILPKKEDLDHEGGYGIYYHFDYVGGPVSYRWLNVTQIERVWEQMNLAYEWGAKDLWIVNVGDLKPMEFPISFFLDFGWDATMEADYLPGYYENWSAQQFGQEYAKEIAEIIALYTKYSARRTPEMLKPDTYSLTHYREADRVVEDYNEILEKSRSIYEELPEEYRSAFYQLVLSPVELLSNLNEMYVAAGKNRLHADQGRASTNYYADKTKELFFRDAELTREYHEELEGGKWNHMMAQTHIGYKSWNNPPVNEMPMITYIQAEASPGLGYVVEHGPKTRWSRNDSGLFSRSFAPFDPVNDQEYFIEIFNRGTEQLSFQVNTPNEWINLSDTAGNVLFDQRIFVSIDWDMVPQEVDTGKIEISGGGRPFEVIVPLKKDLPEVSGFVANNGVVSIEAPHFTDKVESKDISWTVVPNMGRTGSSVTMEPADAPRQEIDKKTPRLEYEFTLLEESDVEVGTYLSPTLNYQKNEGLKYAIAIDDEEPQIINMHEGETTPDWEYPEWWNKSVTDHIKIKTSSHGKLAPGTHTLKVWMIDPGLVFQKFVIDAGGLKPSYLGPPESVRVE